MEIIKIESVNKLDYLVIGIEINVNQKSLPENIQDIATYFLLKQVNYIKKKT